MSIATIRSAGASMTNIQQGMDAVSHNIANVNTIGYKAKRVNFEDVISTFNGTSFSGAAVSSVRSDFKQGSLKFTGEVTDLAIRGEGFFTLLDATGDLVYSRTGHFNLDSNGDLVDPQGHFVLSTGGGKINVPNTVESLEISPSGEIRVREQGQTQQIVLDQLQLASFANNKGLKSVGGNLYTETLNSGPANFSVAGDLTTKTAATQLTSGALENSNVDISQSFAELIAYQRSFQAVARTSTTADQVTEVALGLSA